MLDMFEGPKLDRDYIRKVYLTDQDQSVIYFADGG